MRTSLKNAQIGPLNRVDAICFCSLGALRPGLRETTGRQEYERRVTASQAVLALGICKIF
jgi:hypothetical protein